MTSDQITAEDIQHLVHVAEYEVYDHLYETTCTNDMPLRVTHLEQIVKYHAGGEMSLEEAADITVRDLREYWFVGSGRGDTQAKIRAHAEDMILSLRQRAWAEDKLVEIAAILSVPGGFTITMTDKPQGGQQ